MNSTYNWDDIRQKLIELEAKKAKRYPTADLIPVKKTLVRSMQRNRPRHP